MNIICVFKSKSIIFGVINSRICDANFLQFHSELYFELTFKQFFLRKKCFSSSFNCKIFFVHEYSIKLQPTGLQTSYKLIRSFNDFCGQRGSKSIRRVQTFFPGAKSILNGGNKLHYHDARCVYVDRAGRRHI